MPQYQYVARNLQGQTIKGSAEAANPRNLEQLLLEKGYFLTKFSAEESESANRIEFGNKIKLKEFVVFSRMFAVMLNSGMTIVECISVLKDQTNNKNMKKALSAVHESILKGEMLSASMIQTGMFPEFFVNMLQVGEASGTLEDILNRMAEFYEKDMKLRKKVKGAMTYPIMVLVVTLGVVTFLMVSVLPNFVDMLGQMGGELPWITKFVMSISSFMTSYLLYVLGGFGAIVLGFILFIKSDYGRYHWDTAKVKWPLIKGLTKKIITSRFARSLGLLLGSGIPIIRAVEILENLIGNKYAEEKFAYCANDIREGKPISVSLRKMTLFPPLLIQMIHVGENTGELDSMLSKSASFFDDEVESAINAMTSLIEPMLIVTLAVLVGGIVAAVMMPMMTIMKSVGV